jgi:hypothetical protein
LKRPKNQLIALEKNILKYRAIEMVLILAYAEDLKNFAKQSYESTVRIAVGIAKVKGENIEVKSSIKTSELWDYYASIGVISPEEAREIDSLISFRNDIGHRVHELVRDIGPHSWIPTTQKYNYNALQKLKHYHREFGDRLGEKHFILCLTGMSFHFSIAERAYEEELKRLNQKIKRQYVLHRKEIDRINKLLRVEAEKLEKLFPDYPLSKNGTDRLTKKGEEICYHLFDQKTELLIVAYLLRMSYSAIATRYKKWALLQSRK